MHCTRGLNTDRPVPLKVSIPISNASTCSVARAGLKPFTKAQIQHITLLTITKNIQYINKLLFQIDSQKRLFYSRLKPHIEGFFRKLKTMIHDIFEPSPKFKYNTLICFIKATHLQYIYMRYSSISSQKWFFWSGFKPHNYLHF